MIGVVVLSRNRPDLFVACAASVGLVGGPSVVRQAVLVQHGKDAETEAAAAERGWAMAKPGRNLSYAAGNNLGVAMLTPEVTHALLLNNDAVLTDGALDAMWAARTRGAIVGAVTIQPATGEVSHAGGTFRAQGEGPLAPDHMGRGTPPETHEHDVRCYWATFAAVLIERGLWDELGGLDEDFWYSFEDVDFCLRAREKRGPGNVWVAAGARVLHPEHGTRTGVEDRRNGQVFATKWLTSDRLEKALEGGA